MSLRVRRGDWGRPGDPGVSRLDLEQQWGPFSARAGESPSGGAQPGSWGTPKPASLSGHCSALRPRLVQLRGCLMERASGSPRAWLGGGRKCSEPGQGGRNVSDAEPARPLLTHCCTGLSTQPAPAPAQLSAWGLGVGDGAPWVLPGRRALGQDFQRRLSAGAVSSGCAGPRQEDGQDGPKPGCDFSLASWPRMPPQSCFLFGDLKRPAREVTVEGVRRSRRA